MTQEEIEMSIIYRERKREREREREGERKRKRELRGDTNTRDTRRYKPKIKNK